MSAVQIEVGAGVVIEVGAGVVIEVPNSPIPSIVAIFASAAKPSTMSIVALMTRIAVERGFVFVEYAFVTTTARHNLMFAE